MRPEWAGTHNTLFVRGYVALRVDKTGFVPNPKILDLGEARVAIFVGHVKFLAAGKIQVRVRPKYPTDPPGTPDPAVELNMMPLPWQWTNPEFHTLIGAPSGDSALAHIEEAAALLTIYEGQRLVLDQLFEAEVTPGTPDRFSVRSGAKRVSELKEADVSNGRLKTIEGTRNALEALDEDEKNRILLSLRWFENASSRAGASSGVDLFLTYWIALEALGVPDSRGDIRPLNEKLASIYGGDAATASARFVTGKLAGLRAHIVHHGKRATISGAILVYLESLYVDVFFHVLGLPGEQRAGAFLVTYPNLEKEVDEALRET